MRAAAIVDVVDDDDSCRCALTRMLTASGLRVKSYASGAEFLADLSKGVAMEGPACVLTGLRIPGMDGLRLQQACMEADLILPFVFLTRYGDIPSAVSAMRQGAVDFLDKSTSPDTLLNSVARALDCGARARALRVRQEQLKRRFAALTERERAVLGHVVHGNATKQIAVALSIHRRTVTLHRTNITLKLGVRSVAELTRMAHEAGVFEELH